MKSNADSNISGNLRSKSAENNFSNYQFPQRTAGLTILQRVAKNDRSAIKDSVDFYGDRIWSVAKFYTNSSKDAEILAKEIFLDVWKYADRFDLDAFSEIVVIAMIARRRIKAYSN